MFDKLNKLLENSFSPFSNFSVAAIVVDKDGKEFNGVNVEYAAFGVGICAERTAISSAIAAGVEFGSVKEVHILAKYRKNVDKNSFTYPCGICRQAIVEVSNKKATIYMYNLNGKVKKDSISKLIPESFGATSLK